MLRLHGRPGAALGSPLPSLDANPSAQGDGAATRATAAPDEAVYWRA